MEEDEKRDELETEIENNAKVEPEVSIESETNTEEPSPVEERKVETPVASEPVQTNSKGKNGWLKYVLIGIGAIIAILIFLLIRGCDKGNKYKIKLHYGDEVIEVDQNFKLGDLEVDGGKITFLVDSDGHIVDPNSKLDPEKEYSGHIVPDGKEKVKVTYKNGNNQFTVEYQKGSGLLFPKDPKKAGYVFLGWQNEETKEFPKEMTPVMKDMTLVAKFGKKVDKSCKVNCDTNDDGKCDLNCDIDGDGKADTNIDTNGDGKPDTNITPNGNQSCKVNCDTNGDGKADTNIDTNGDGQPDTNLDTDGNGTPDVNIDKDLDGKCDENCIDGIELSTDTNTVKYTFSCNSTGTYVWTRLEWTIVYLKVNGEEVKIPELVDIGSGKYKVYDYSSYIGSGKTLEFEYKLIRTDKTGQKYYYIEYATYTFEGNCDSKKNEEQQNNQEQPNNDNNNKDNNSTDTNKNSVVNPTTPDKPKEDTTDNGTITLSASSKCMVSGHRVNITANVSNAKDSTVTWSKDSCLTINGSGNNITIIGNDCGSTAKVTGTLNNGKSDTVTIDFENNLSVTVKNGGRTETTNESGNYVGWNLTIITNVPAYITGNYLDGDGGMLRTTATFSAKYGGVQTITIRTACGQTKTISIESQIN